MAKMNGKLALSKRLIVKWANKDVSIEQVIKLPLFQLKLHVLFWPHYEDYKNKGEKYQFQEKPKMTNTGNRAEEEDIR